MTTRLPLLTDAQVGPPDLVAAIRQRRGGELIDLDRLLLELLTVTAAYNMVSRLLVAFDVQPHG